MAGTTRGRAPHQDFNPDELVQSSQHQQDIDGLNTRIKSLEDKFGTNEKIADTLCEASERALRMDELFEKKIVKQIQQNAEVRKELRKVIDEADRAAVRAFIKRVGIGIWTLIIALVSGAIALIINTFNKGGN